METLQGNMDQIEVNKELMIQEIELEKILQTTLRKEEESLRLRSRNLWLINGDQNTFFFQNQCNERQCRNTIREVKKDDGTSITDQAKIINEVRNFFLNLYNNEEEVSQEDMAEMVKDIPHIVNLEDLEVLEAPIYEEEIKKAI